MVKKHTLLTLLAVISISFLSGCSIAKKVEAIPTGTKIETIYIQKNPKIHMSGFHDELVSQLTGLGFQVKTFEGNRPPEARQMMSYTANWRWDMAMYLFYFQATLQDGNKILGKVEYDATMGGGRPDKFGKTSEKIRPLLIDLFQHAENTPPTATAMGSATH